MSRKSRFYTPGMGNSFGTWIRILREVGRGKAEFPYWFRAFMVGLISLISSPFQWYERIRLRKKIEAMELDPEPVFIIGHWRSGTTHIHNILSQDERFGYLTTLQGIFPRCYQTNFLFPLLTDWLMPPTRPMDKMKISLYSPQEEEIVMVNASMYSFYQFWHFPKLMRDIYHRYARLDRLTDRQREEWKSDYIYQLKKAAVFLGKNRLVLKNPPNTVRIPYLLEIFPKARFIFIHRSSREVFGSTKKLHGRVVPYFNLQKVDTDQVNEDIVYVYKDMMEVYLRDREVIPEGQLEEVFYRDLIQEPEETLRNIYTNLGLGDFDEYREKFSAYINSKKGYKVSHYEYTEEEEKILEEMEKLFSPIEV